MISYVSLSAAKVVCLQGADARTASKCELPGNDYLLALLLADVWADSETRRKEKFGRGPWNYGTSRETRVAGRTPLVSLRVVSPLPLLSLAPGLSRPRQGVKYLSTVLQADE
jgi:hypothetical protein